MTNRRGMLIVLSGPSGCGKGTMMAQILKDERFTVSVSATTRAPREGEIEGRSYFFLTKEEFQRRITENRLLEYAEYCGNYYGTPREAVEERLEEGKNVILEIEVLGAFQVKERFPDTLLVFVIPPSLQELERRLRARGTETEEAVLARVTRAKEELSQARRYDYVIENDRLEDAVADFFTIVRAENLRAARRVKEIGEMAK